MSVRAISSFFEKSHGLQVSASTVTRALKNKDEHLNKIAEYLSITGEYMARTYETTKEYLFQLEEQYAEHGEGTPLGQLLGRAAEDAMNAESAGHEDFHRISHDTETICRMKELWDDIPAQIQRDLRGRVLTPTDEESMDWDA